MNNESLKPNIFAEGLAPSVSICLPVYNGEQYLALAIESALRQSMTDFELLISDDASNDHSWEIIQSFAKQDGRIKAWRNEKRLGLFANYNACLKASSGNFIKLFAQDDVFEISILEKMRGILEGNEQVALVACAKNFIDGFGSVISPSNEEESKVCQAFLQDTEISADEAIAGTIIKPLNWLGEPSTVMYRRRHAGDGFDTRFCQLGDLDYWYRILDYGTYFYLSEPLCGYRRHDKTATLSNTFTLLSTADIFLLVSKYAEHITSQGFTLTDYCSSKVEEAADWTRYVVENKFILAFPEFFKEGAYDPSEPYGEGHDMLLLAHRLMAFHALACVSRYAEKAQKALVKG